MAVKDRLQELQNMQHDKNKHKTLDSKIDIDDPKAQNIQTVFDEVGLIRQWMNEIRDNTRTMKKLYSDTTYHSSKSSQEEFDSRMQNNLKTASTIFSALKDLEGKVMSTKDDDSAPARIRRLQYSTLKQNHAECLREFHVFLEKYRDESFAIMKQAAMLTNKNITNEEFENIMENESTALFVDNIIAETATAKRELRDILDRHKELLKVENSIKEIKELFLHMARLVHEQQDKVDRVESYANDASSYIGDGAMDLQKAKSKKQKTRKCKLYLAGGGVILLIVIIFILVN